MPELQQLHVGHAPAVLAFELANRAYFAAFISDRGDEFFDQFTGRYTTLLAEQEAGLGAFYVLVAEDGSILGRFNLVFAGELCRLAVARHGLRTLKAATAHENVASQKVLVKAGFVPAGPAGPADLGGKQGTWYQRDLAADRP